MTYSIGKKIVIFIVLLVILLNWIVEPTISDRGLFNLSLLPKKAIVIIDIVLIFIWFYFIQRKENHITVNITVFIFLVTGINLFIVLIFDGGFTNLISGFRNYFIFLPMFFLGNYFSEHNYNISFFLKLFLILMLFQVPISIFQYISLSGINYSGTIYDFVAGTMGGQATDLLSFLLVCSIVFIVFQAVLSKNYKLLFFVPFLLLPTALSETKGTLVLLGILSVFVFLFAGKNFARKLFSIIITFLMILLFNYIYSNYINLDRNVLDINYLINNELAVRGRDQKLNRIKSLDYSIKTISNNNSILFGIGIGNGSVNHFGKAGQFNNFYSVRNNWSLVLLESGIVGIISYMFIIIYIVFFFWKKTKNKYIDTYDLANIYSLITITVFILYGGLWTNIIFRNQFMVPYLFIIGYYFKKEYKSNRIYNEVV